VINTEDGVTFVISDRFKHYFQNIKLDYARSMFGGRQFQFLKV
jgi:Fe-S cluster assembly iron-binding protein IscA